jgi:hypothetical protein
MAGLILLGKHREETAMRFDLGRVREGMTALSTRGEKLGKVIRCDDESFVVEQGFFFRKDYELYYEYVTEARGDELIYALEDSRLVAREAGRATAIAAKAGDVKTSLEAEEAKSEDATRAGRTLGRQDVAESSATGREGANLKKA